MGVYIAPPGACTSEVQLRAGALHERALALELPERNAHRLELALDLRRPLLLGMIVERLHPVARDDRDHRLIRAEASRGRQLLEYRDRRAASRLGQQTLGGRQQVDPREDLRVAREPARAAARE